MHALRGDHCDNGFDKIDDNPRANHTNKCIDTHSQMDACMHTYMQCNALHRYKSHHFKHTPLHDLGGPPLSVCELRGDNDWW